MSLPCSFTDTAFTIFIDKQHRFCCHQKWWRSFAVTEHNFHTGNDQVWSTYFIFSDRIDISFLNVLVRYCYRSVPLIRPLRKYAPPLFSAKVPAQGGLTRYNAPPPPPPGERLLEHQNYTCLLYVASAFSKTIVVSLPLLCKKYQQTLEISRGT